MEITISSLTINKFKGLRQDIDYPELPLNYCHVSQNLNMDDPVGSLKVRGGSVQYYNTALTGYPFTSLISAFEYRFEESSETVLIVNDNGTLKTMTDGAAPASLTLPTGPGSTATLAASFQNYYMGYKDHILITTGNAATNYILWYGYVKRVNADNTGIFNNVSQKTGYLLLKSQMASAHGTFANVHDAVQVGDYYYFSFINSKWIEKRDATTMQLIERFEVSQDAMEGESVALATDDTYIYVSYVYDTSNDGVADGVRSKKITPAGWATEATHGLAGATLKVGGICSDGTNVFVAINHASAGVVHRLNSSMVSQANSAINDVLDICCDTVTAIATGFVYLLLVGDLHQRQKDDLSANVYTNTTYTLQIRCFFTAGSYVYTSSTFGTGTIYRYSAANVSGTVVAHTKVVNPHALILQATFLRGISRTNGTIEAWSASGADTTIFPRFISINTITTQASGLMGVGTYFYKIAIEDMDGQIYTLSDPVIQTLDTADYSILLRLTCHDDDVNYYYRIKNIHIFRAYNEVEDAGVPSTDYKFLKTVDINSSGWQDDTTAHEIYYYAHLDNISEDLISTTTYLEMSSIDDTVKPRYINGKYFTWINDQLHLANFSHDGETYRNRVIRSGDNAPDAISFYDYYDFDVGIGEAINGITEMFGRSIVFKERKMGVFYDGRWEKTFEPGAHNSHSFFKVNDVLYYVSLRGIHAFNGSKLMNIHYPVIDLFDAVDKDTYLPNVFFIDGRDRIYFTMRSSRVLVYNVKYETWTNYTSGMAFFGLFKNYVGSYIGWNATSLYEIEDNTSVNDGEVYGGGTGTAITITYESPLIRLSGIDGETAIPISHRHRVLKDVAVGSTDLITFTWYEYQDDASGRTSVYTQAIDSPVGSYAAVKSYFFDPIIGESFSARLNGAIDGGNFIYHGLTIEYEQAGHWDGR